jgi:hypothetical protein
MEIAVTTDCVNYDLSRVRKALTEILEHGDRVLLFGPFKFKMDCARILETELGISAHSVINAEDAEMRGASYIVDFTGGILDRPPPSYSTNLPIIHA